jgi:hypothetical protein
MDKNDFKIKIVDFYKDVEKPIINNLYEDKDTKELMILSTKNDINLFKKGKNMGVIKDKRKLLKEIDVIKKKKVREFSSNIKSNDDFNEIKNSNNKFILDLESMEDLKKNIDNEKIYLRLQNLALLSNSENKENKENKKNFLIPKIKDLEIKDIKNIKGGNSNVKIQIDSESSEYIEVFSN